MKLLAISHTYVVDLNQQNIDTFEKRHHVEVAMVAPSSWKGEYGEQEFRSLSRINFPIYTLPVRLSGQISLYFFGRGLKSIFEKFKPEIIFFHGEPWSLAGLQVALTCRFQRVPLVMFTNQNLLKRYPPPFSWIEQLTYKTSNAIAVLSEDVRSVLVSKGYKGPTPELPYPCDLSLFFPGKELELREQLGAKGIVLGYMGRLVTEKGLDSFVDAATQLMDEHPQLDFTVLFVGSGDQEKVLKARTARTPHKARFIFAGSVMHKEAPRYLRCFDIMVLPSLTTPAWKEQFGRVIVESLSCQVPVVGSNSGHIPYLIEETQGGCVFTEGDSKDFAAKLLPLIKDAELRHQLGQNGSAMVHARYSQEAVADQLFQILDSCLKGLE